jgi:hypothetical protein
MVVDTNVELLEEAILLKRISVFLAQGDKVFAEFTKMPSDRWKLLITQKQIEERLEEEDVQHTYKYGIRVRDTGLEKKFVDLTPVLKNLKDVGLECVLIRLT